MSAHVSEVLRSELTRSAPCGSEPSRSYNPAPASRPEGELSDRELETIVGGALGFAGAFGLGGGALAGISMW